MHAMADEIQLQKVGIGTSHVSCAGDAPTNIDATMHDEGGKRRWQEAELQYLDTWVGVKSIGEICLRLHRSERALRCQLCRRRLSAKVREGWGLEQLRIDLHLRPNKVLRYAVQGVLRVQSAQVCIHYGHAATEVKLSKHVARTLPIGEAARALGWSHAQIFIAVLAGRFRLTNVRITEASVMRLSASAAFAETRKRLHPAINSWLEGSGSHAAW